jgi:hypothetical protein
MPIGIKADYKLLSFPLYGVFYAGTLTVTARRPRNIRRLGANHRQVFVACGLVAARFSAPFFFCFGFLASRLDRFCSLFATTLSLHVSRRRICRLCAAMQP